MVYGWKIPGLYSVPAQAAGEELDRIYRERGKIDPADVVNESRPETAVLHPCFEWRDEIAAEKYREEQARALVRCVVMVPEAEGRKPMEVRAYFHVQETYHPTSVIVRDEDKYTALLQAAFQELAAFRKKYAVLSGRDELRELLAAIDAAIGGKTARNKL